MLLKLQHLDHSELLLQRSAGSALKPDNVHLLINVVFGAKRRAEVPASNKADRQAKEHLAVYFNRREHKD